MVCRSSGIDIVQKGLGYRLRGLFGESDRGLHFGVGLHRGQIIGVGGSGVDQVPGEPWDRVALAPEARLLRILVVLLVPGVMSAIAVGVAKQEGWPATGSGARDGVDKGLAHRQYIHAVDLARGDVKHLSAGQQRFARRDVFDRREIAESVVLTHKNHRQ